MLRKHAAMCLRSLRHGTTMLTFGVAVVMLNCLAGCTAVKKEPAVVRRPGRASYEVTVRECTMSLAARQPAVNANQPEAMTAVSVRRHTQCSCDNPAIAKHAGESVVSRCPRMLARFRRDVANGLDDVGHVLIGHRWIKGQADHPLKILV